ncbi:hypothetical protein HII17_05230 [Thalassotalea sp. M1531]|uniref:Porin n=1 Tax=Thalassotalea algicola TaxID=2716224 RepID=A0A7Y0LC50_9GAMM|nr:hypothetical protein [Thalassotalea algicola]NMP30961.1 hypothetical protein [Thalassotalea algicola]
MVKLVVGGALIFFSSITFAVETSLKGILDVHAYHVNNTSDAYSYLKGDYGKFRFDTGTGFALAQLGIRYELEWQNNFSATIVGNAFADRGNNEIGITEAFVRYKGLPSQNGWRFQSKLGVFYPSISLENVATAWSTPYTLTSSSLNNWIGEELRHTGVNFSIEKLGKASKSSHSFSADLSLFQNNDTAGTMLTWHGWTMGSRQALLHEKLVVQDFPARDNLLAEQAAKSDPFIEIDHRWGAHIATSWRIENKLKLNLGYYDNMAEEGLVEHGQYTWATDFIHAGLKYKLTKQWELISQYMKGDTAMKSLTGIDVVKAEYDNMFLMMRYQRLAHHVAMRFEHFNVDDQDETIGDNNNENGNGVTLSYRYQLSKKQFILSEFNWLRSERPSRSYELQPVDLVERQYQLAYRLYF